MGEDDSGRDRHSSRGIGSGGSEGPSSNGAKFSARKTSKDSRSSSRPSRPSRPPQGSDRRSGPAIKGNAEPIDGPIEFNDGLGDIDVFVVPKAIRRDLETLAPHTRARVERWLAASILTMEEDPQEAFMFAKEAGKLGGRSAVVREAVGIAAYQAGDFKVAKAEIQAARRMAGRDDLIPVLADCERALGNAQKALDLGAEPAARALRGEAQAELVLVLSGARMDLGQYDAAVALLRGPCAQTPVKAPWVRRIYYGYAEALLAAGNLEEARSWFMRAASADVDGETDASDRVDEVGDPQATIARRAELAEQEDDFYFLDEDA